MNNTTIYKTWIILFAALLGLLFSCRKFLEEKPDQKLATPASLQEAQGLLDNFSVLNQAPAGAGEASSDNYYLLDADWEAIPYVDEQRIYTWEKDQLFAVDGRINEWYGNYQAVYYCNTVLAALEKIPRETSDPSAWDNIKGQALFFRAEFLLKTVLLWAVAYDPATAATGLGIPIRLTDDFNVPSTRASLEQSYQQILGDLEQSVRLLAEKSSHPGRPGKPAAYGLLARVNLAMAKFPQAELYADSCLNLQGSLMDYNELDVSTDFPFQQFNPEVIHWNRILAPGLLSQHIARISPELYERYKEEDLRKAAFFITNPDGTHSFKGYYEQLTAPFGGVAVDEIVLIKAECAARAANLHAALSALNQLMANRIRRDAFRPVTAGSAAEALQIILEERRKELLMRDLRWMDIKRLNKQGAGIVLSRTLKGQQITLLPNDPRYALPIPEDVIELSGIPQNPR